MPDLTKTPEVPPEIHILTPEKYPDLNFGEQKVLYARGNLDLLDNLKRSICVTGPRPHKNEHELPEEKRKVSEQALHQAEWLGSMLAKKPDMPMGVSGFAIGIDDAFHRPIIDNAKATIAWFGNASIVMDATRENRRKEYAQKLVQDHLVISPYPDPSMRVFGEFYLRNQLMVLNSQVLVAFDIPDDPDSGTFSTVEYAIRANKPVVIIDNHATKMQPLSHMSTLAFEVGNKQVHTASTASDAMEKIMGLNLW